MILARKLNSRLRGNDKNNFMRCPGLWGGRKDKACLVSTVMCGWWLLFEINSLRSFPAAKTYVT
ncbi:MAG: hypothetical protein JEZ07_11755 [Phycisphaerae bacterium]|nr:hypothetical protein [Phycisphaerae bacterium]